MDLSLREVIKENEEIFEHLDMDKIKPFLRDSKIFTNDMLKEIYSNDSKYALFNLLPTRGPKAFSSFIGVLKRAEYHKEANILLNPSKYELKSKYEDQDFYPMKSKPLGYCIIINNVKFEPVKTDDSTDAKALEYRYGSDIDVENLQRFFGKIGYKVKVFTNLKGRQMKKCLEQISKDEQLHSMYCCFIVILSHGGNIHNLDVVYGVDNVCEEKNDILKLLDNMNCENLRMKPKVFIFQTCRGEYEDEGVYVIETADSSRLIKIPQITDTYVIHASLPYHKAYRYHETGSVLIEELISVLSERYLYEDFDSMIIKVDKKVQSRLSYRQNKQVLHIERYGFKANFHICSNEEFKGGTRRNYLYHV